MSQMVEILLHEIVGPEIELPTAIGDVDLHNFADFEQLEYKTEGILRLVWLSHERGEFRIGKLAISNAEILIRDVKHLAVTPRDPDMPISEDRTLEHFEVEKNEGKDWHIIFSFQGGLEIDVIAAQIDLQIEPEETIITSFK